MLECNCENAPAILAYPGAWHIKTDLTCKINILPSFGFLKDLLQPLKKDFGKRSLFEMGVGLGLVLRLKDTE